MMARVRPGGSLAVQMPDTRQQPSHVLMREVAAELGVLPDDTIATIIPSNAHEPSEFDAKLVGPMCNALDMWSSVYVQRLEGPEPVYEYVRSTGLRPLVDELGGEGSEAAGKALTRVSFPSPVAVMARPCSDLTICRHDAWQMPSRGSTASGCCRPTRVARTGQRCSRSRASSWWRSGRAFSMCTWSTPSTTTISSTRGGRADSRVAAESPTCRVAPALCFMYGFVYFHFDNV